MCLNESFIRCVAVYESQWEGAWLHWTGLCFLSFQGILVQVSYLGSSASGEASPESLFPPRLLALSVAPTKGVGSSLRLYLSYL